MNRKAHPIIAITLALLTFPATSAVADQCSTANKKQTEMVRTTLKVGSRALYFCEPCGEKKPSRIETVESLENILIPDSETKEDRFEIRVNGKSIDLAYVFFQEKGPLFTNLGLHVDCGAENVSHTIMNQRVANGSQILSALWVRIKPRKKSGHKWDANGKPDPMVQVSVNGKELPAACATQKNTLTVQCKPERMIRVGPMLKIVLRLRDKDAFAHDEIGTATINASDKGVDSIGFLSTTSEGQIDSAMVSLKPLPKN